MEFEKSRLPSDRNISPGVQRQLDRTEQHVCKLGEIKTGSLGKERGNPFAGETKAREERGYGSVRLYSDKRKTPPDHE